MQGAVFPRKSPTDAVILILRPMSRHPGSTRFEERLDDFQRNSQPFVHYMKQENESTVGAAACVVFKR